jgi:hypothetical protein
MTGDMHRCLRSNCICLLLYMLGMRIALPRYCRDTAAMKKKQSVFTDRQNVPLQSPTGPCLQGRRFGQALRSRLDLALEQCLRRRPVCRMVLAKSMTKEK